MTEKTEKTEKRPLKLVEELRGLGWTRVPDPPLPPAEAPTVEPAEDAEAPRD